MDENVAFFEDFIFRKTSGVNRFTQDSPVFPEVWAQYFLSGENERVDLIFTPHRSYSGATLLTILRNRLKDFNTSSYFKKSPPYWGLATSGETIAAKLTFEELIHVALPLTSWWQHYLLKEDDKKASNQRTWLIETINAISWYQRMKTKEPDLDKLKSRLLSGDFNELTNNLILEEVKTDEIPITPLWAVSWNRPASISLYKSNKTIKSEPSRRLFDIDGAGITWAVIDSGIDATHTGFRKFDKANDRIYPSPFVRHDRQPNKTRIIATYDFTKLREIMTNLEGAVLSDDNGTATGARKFSLR